MYSSREAQKKCFGIKAKHFFSTDVNFASIVSQFSHGGNVIDVKSNNNVTATMFQSSLARTKENRLVIYKISICCHASVHKNLDGNEFRQTAHYKKNMLFSVFSISTKQ